MMLTDREVGECVCVREGSRVRVTRADPIIHITTALLEADNIQSLVIDGDLVTIGDDNPVTYRITERGTRVVEAVRVA